MFTNFFICVVDTFCNVYKYFFILFYSAINFHTVINMYKEYVCGIIILILFRIFCHVKSKPVDQAGPQ